MDPALHEMLAHAAPESWVEAIALLAPGAVLPAPARVVARFGAVVTCRAPVAMITTLRRAPGVISLKAARRLTPGAVVEERVERAATEPTPLVADGGAGVVVGILDWGLDIAHPWLRRPDGGTRALAIWDQRAPGRGPAPYGYGALHDRRDLDRDLAASTPYARYPWGQGTRPAHGTHVASIVARLAPAADLVFVHLATADQPETADLGDSVRLLEALDFVRAAAGDRPWVANLSLGRTAGDHTGGSLVERAMDAALEAAPGCAIVQSAGNYYDRALHHEGRIRAGGSQSIEWLVHDGDATGNELEVWYSGRDRLAVAVVAPGGVATAHAELGERTTIRVADREVGRLYHRAHDPTNGDHHVDLVLDASAPTGPWSVTLTARDVVDGRYHAWIERDAPGAHQSRFPRALASRRSTLGTIANGFRTVVVGAYDPAVPGRPIAPFSSAGPTRDGRCKPDVLAAGVAIAAARSTPAGAAPGTGGAVALSGTSMAAPHVTGTIACLFGRVAPRRLRIDETRALVLGTAVAARGDPDRAGAGYLDPAAVLAAATTDLALHEENPMSSQPLPETTRPWRSGDLMIRAGTAEQPPAVWRVVADAAWPHDRIPDELPHDDCEAGVYGLVESFDDPQRGVQLERILDEHGRLLTDRWLVRLPAPESRDDDDDFDDPLAEDDEDLEAYERLADLLTERNIPAAERPRFAQIDEANQMSESGRFQRSRTATVSGAPAGFGRAQLNTSEHVGALREPPSAIAIPGDVRTQLEADGVDRAALDDLHRRGMAARNWYDAVVLGDRATRDPEPPGEVRTAASGDVDGLVARFGTVFTSQTGLPADELRLMAQFRRFRAAAVDGSHRLKHELDRIQEALRDVPDEERDEQAVAELARRHPELYIDRLLAAHPGASNRMGARGILHYIERPSDSNESRASYYTRGAQTSPHWDRFESILEHVDLLTSRLRHISNYLAARAVATQLAGFDALDPREQTVLLGQMARMAHGGPGRFQRMFGRPRQPTIHSVDDYRATIEQYFRAGTNVAQKVRRSLTSFTRNIRDVLGLAVDDRGRLVDPTTELFLPNAATLDLRSSRERRARRSRPRSRPAGRQPR